MKMFTKTNCNLKRENVWENFRIIRTLCHYYNFSILSSTSRAAKKISALNFRNAIFYYLYEDKLSNYSPKIKKMEDYLEPLYMKYGNDSYDNLGLKIT